MKIYRVIKTKSRAYALEIDLESDRPEEIGDILSLVSQGDIVYLVDDLQELADEICVEIELITPDPYDEP